MKRTTLLACALAMLALTSCIGDPSSPLYQSGYGDGCSTANAESNPGSKPQRDEALYAGDSQYRTGWIAGHSDCRANATGHP